MARQFSRWLIGGVVATLLLSLGAWPHSIAATSCANYLAIDGIHYIDSRLNNDGTLGRPLAEASLGAEYRRVEHNMESLDESRLPEGLFGIGPCGRDGNFSTDLPIGTPLYEVDGYDPTFRLAARVADGTIVLFDANYVPAARTGGERFDIEGRVVSVLLTTRKGRVLAEIEDSETVARLVELMVAAPIAEPDSNSERKRPLTILYQLDDETVVPDHWYPDTGELLSGIQAPAEYSDILRAALTAVKAPEATPTAS